MISLRDRWGRHIVRLRLGVSDRCNFACVYCRPGLTLAGGRPLLSTDEIVGVARAAVNCGIRTIRITGGEPLLRDDLVEIVARMSELSPGLDIAITTNGSLLERWAVPLRRAGLGRVNVSLDSLRQDRFEAITGSESLDEVLRGLEAAKQAGLEPVKVNAVVLRGANDDEVAEIAEFAHERGYHPRFIEFMPLDGRRRWVQQAMVPVDEIQSRIESRFHLTPVSDSESPGDEYVLGSGPTRVSLIGAITRPFCARCNRLRVTADGFLRACLFSSDEQDLRPALAAADPAAVVAEALVKAAAEKPRSHALGSEGFVQPRRPMLAIGG